MHKQSVKSLPVCASFESVGAVVKFQELSCIGFFLTISTASVVGMQIDRDKTSNHQRQNQSFVQSYFYVLDLVGKFYEVLYVIFHCTIFVKMCC